MIILLNTSTSVCKLSLLDGEKDHEYNWQADLNLANGLLKFLSDKLNENNLTWSSISGIGVYRGPGSFTGLRIGLTVLNTIADSENIEIVGGTGDNWKNEVLEKIQLGINEKIILPFYSSEANITISNK